VAQRGETNSFMKHDVVYLKGVHESWTSCEYGYLATVMLDRHLYGMPVGKGLKSATDIHGPENVLTWNDAIRRVFGSGDSHMSPG
jgi:hypothetical protein